MEFTVISLGFTLLLMELCVDWLQILQILQDQKINCGLLSSIFMPYA